MTTLQDPPPQSRRAARESERAAQASDAGAEYAPFLAPTETDAARERTETSLPAPGGRRAQRPAGDASAQLPVTAESLSSPASEPTTLSEPVQPVQPFRMRDYSPEGRRSAGTAPEATLQPAELDYQTAAAPEVTPAPVAAAVAAPTADAATPPLTRRQLRALEAERAAATPALVEPAATDASAAALANAIAEFEVLARSGQIALPGAAATEPEAATAERTAANVEPEAEPEQADEAESATEPKAAGSAPVAPALIEPGSFQPEPFQPEPFEPEPQRQEPAVAAEVIFAEPPVVRESYTPPVGHWSRQADLEDDVVYENTLSREVGGSNLSTTTSALILPSIPQSDFSGLIAGTGEILITGTIELPHGLSTMGADARHFDNPDVDHMFDAFDKELVSNDSQPVRAIRAVSTHTATRGVIQANTKPHSNRLLTAAIIAVGIVALGTIALLAVYIVSTMNS